MNMTRDFDKRIYLKLPTVAATQQLGYILGRSLPAGSILLLYGDLGSGKTTLVNAIGNGLGIADLIVSPTFVLVNEYNDGRLPLYHFDLYRLNPSETRAFDIEQYWDEREYEPGIIAIEWADRLCDSPPYAITIHLSTSPFMTQQSANTHESINSDGAVHEGTEERYAALILEGDGQPDICSCWDQLKHLEQSLRIL